MGKRKKKNKSKTSDPEAKEQKTSEDVAPEVIHAPYNPFTIPYQNTMLQEILPPLVQVPGLHPSQYPPTMPLQQIVSHILKNPPAMGFEAAMEELEVGPRVSAELVEEVLKLSHGAGNEAIKFFRWAGWRLGGHKHTPKAWNLLVDLLGRGKMFDEIWGCIKVMKSEGILSVETFSSVFSRYLDADKDSEAEMTFEVMEQYGCPRDVVSLNCFFRALCRHSRLHKAQEYWEKLKGEIKPNAETYAVLLEGCEQLVNVKKAKNIFGEMIIRIGWDPNNTAAYSSFLKTLINSNEAAEAFKFLNVLKGRNCLLDLDFYIKVLRLLHQVRDTKHCCGFWGVMKLSGIIPDLTAYNTMIAVYCDSQQFDAAYRLLDEMVINGVFPNFKTYNSLFEALITARNVDEASSIFREMTKNECYPLYSNYRAAIKMYLEVDDPEMALTMWRQMIQKGVAPKEDVATTLIEGFCNLKKVSEARKYCKEAISRGINIPSETMRKLRDALMKDGREETYAQLVRSISMQV